MTMPKGWRTPEVRDISKSTAGPMPVFSTLTRPVVELIDLITSYKGIILNVFETETGKKTNCSQLYNAWNRQLEVNQLEILPLEGGYSSGDGFSVAFNNTQFRYPRGCTYGFQLIPISNIINIEIISEREILIKQDLLKIVFISKEDKSITAIIDIDGDLEDIVRNLRIQKQLELNTTYWSPHSLTIRTGEIHLYPFTPFLAQEEIIIWQNITKHNIDEKRIIWIDTVTNYRIFQYDYEQHIGKAILLPMVKNATFANVTSASVMNYRGTYPLSSYSMTGIENTNTASMIGDIQFYTEDGFCLIFEEINDPERLWEVVKKVKEDYHNLETTITKPEPGTHKQQNKADDKFLDFTQNMINRKMPPISQLTRPMVDYMKLKLQSYDMNIVDISETSTGAKTSLIGLEQDKQLNCVQIQPVHGCILTFGNINNGNEKYPTIQLSDISSLRITKLVGKFYKIQKVTLEFAIIGRDKKQYILKIEVMDNDLANVVKDIRIQKELESDEKYWQGYSLSFSSASGQSKSLNIYPRTPFLAESEEIIFQNYKTDKSFRPELIIGLETLTNYRIFQYSYPEHYGSAILLTSLENVNVTNEKYIPISSKVGSYTHGNDLEQIVRNAPISNTIGDITFVSEDKSYISFMQISDPKRLANVVRALKENLSQVKIGEAIALENDDIAPALQVVESWEKSPTQEQQVSKGTNLICNKCDKANTNDANFCGSCGFRLTPVCDECGHSNPSEAIFCSQCGSKLRSHVAAPKPSTYPTERIGKGSIIDSNFFEYLSSERYFKINYPAAWTKLDEDLPDPLLKVAFSSPRESPSDQFSENLVIGLHDIPSTTSHNYLDLYIAGLRETNPDFTLVESLPTTLGGHLAHQIIYTYNKFKSLTVIAIKDGRSYVLVYTAEREKYVKFLALVEQMISSFQFLE